MKLQGVPTYSLFSSIIFDALTLKFSFSYLIFLVYFKPTDEAKAFLLSPPESEAVDEQLKLCSSKLVSLSFPELAMDPTKAVVASEFAESLKSFFFMLIY